MEELRVDGHCVQYVLTGAYGQYSDCTYGWPDADIQKRMEIPSAFSGSTAARCVKCGRPLWAS